ncbi:sulfotransferase family protein [Owenweeksia hongkongensis DSM 17368]|uniref:Sulfotransferase family protein n=1 Tax=Owenweeksia hongkongensis (strain DSM 17368 / CIP 108786 / JCM 12287 / NRRL B-23963 / UST20020801) TaxID=926562 RepID=G8R7P5_OWEHD|nr:sulfotransferase [Owenweeksia hongkongensis]AEV32398.1 sulfotransferase family protein [Owenweeksia hongkongensis DSM 17368]
MEFLIFVAMANQGVIFLTGVGRSGTTMLQSMLHSHSEINFSVETHFIKRYVVPFLLTKEIVKGGTLASDKFIQRLSLKKQAELCSKDFASIEDLYQAFCEIMKPENDSTITFLGDKDTEYVRYFSHIKEFVPKAYMIHIVRDPRDVVASRLKTEWGAKRSPEFHMAEYQYYLKKVRKEGPELFGDRFYELKYEDLLENPKRELTGLLSVLNLTYEPEMLNFYKKGNDLVSDDERKWKDNVSKPLDKSNSGKWRSSLSINDAATLQHGLEDFFDEMDYDKVTAKVSLVQKMKVQAIKQLFVGKTFKERLK